VVIRRAPTQAELVTRLHEDGSLPERFLKIITTRIGVAPEGRYRHWDSLRHLSPPGDLSVDEWWLGVKIARTTILRKLPLIDSAGDALSYAMPDQALELLHFIDQHASGEIAMPEVVTADESARRHYLVNSLMEEAIRSSQLEGASTTRPVAKEMIRTGRPPRDRSERMILNNYNALRFLREDAASRLTPALVMELHRILTEGTLDKPDGAGRLQGPNDERVAVWNAQTNEIVHAPPAATELEGRLHTLCAFANGELEVEGFLHPVVRAILLHFMLGYDHPFEDGNGRTARALFYWAMRKQGYWLAEYLSISRILREAPAQYGRSFMYTETDEGDTTYFILYQLHVIKRAMRELHDYLERKVSEVREVERLIRQSDEYNHRQLALLGNAVRSPDQRYTFSSHARSHNVSIQSARHDLLDLLQRGLLTRRRVGHKFVFAPVAGLSEQLND